MINEQHAKKESEESLDNDESLTNKNSSEHSAANSIENSKKKSADSCSDSINKSKNCSNVSQSILQPISTNSELELEIREIIETIISKTLFSIIENNLDQLANRSSNTLGMRVKDSLILKLRQSNKKTISFDALKTSALVCGLIVDDDIQIRFLPRIDSLAPSSAGSENSSTKQKKSVSLDEEVRVFEGTENEDYNQNDVSYFNELIDNQNAKIMDRDQESDDKTYDFSSQKGSNFTVESKDFSEKQDDGIEKSTILDSSNDLKNIDDSNKESTIFSASLKHNQIIVNLAETTTRVDNRKIKENSETESEKMIKENDKNDSELESNAISVIEDIVMNPEKKSSLLSRIVRWEAREEENIVPEKTEVTNEIENLVIETNDDKISADYSERLNNEKNDEIDVESSSENGEKEFEELEESKLSNERVKIKSTNSLGNDNPSSNKSLLKVSSKMNELSKQSSITNNIVNFEPSTNDPSLKQTLSKVLREAIRSSGKLSKTDINDVINLDLSNSSADASAEKSLAVFSKDENILNDIETDLKVVNDEEFDKSDSNLKREKRSKNSVKTMLAQVYSVAGISQQQNIEDEISSKGILDKIEIKMNRSRSSLRDKKSSEILKNYERNDKENILQSYDNENTQEMMRKKSMLNVVSKSSVDDHHTTTVDHLQLEEHDSAIKENADSRSSLSLKNSKVENESEILMIGNGSRLDNPLEPSINVKKRSRFMEGLKRSLQSKKNRTKQFGGKNETRIEVSSGAQTDMEEDLTSVSLEDRNDVEKSSQSIESKLTESLTKDESKSFDRFSKRSTEKVDNNDEEKMEKSLSKSSNQLAEEKIVEVYSIIVDSISKQNNSLVSPEIADSSSIFDSSSNLGEGKMSDINESKAKLDQNKFDELVVKFSEDLESSPIEQEKEKNKSIAKLWQKISAKSFSKNTIPEKSLSDKEIAEGENSVNDSNKEEKNFKRSKKSAMQKESRKRSKSKSRESEIVKSELNSKVTTKNLSSVFPDKSESLIVAFSENPSIQGPSGRQLTVNEDRVESDSVVINNESNEELQSQDLIRQDKEKQSLMSNFKSIFKSLHKSESQKYSISSIEDAEKTKVTKESMQSLKSNNLESSSSDVLKLNREENVNSNTDSDRVQTIQSTKSLQDNRKRSKNRRKTGHKLLDDENVPSAVTVKPNCSFQNSITESNSKISAIDNSEVKEKTSPEISNRRKMAKQKQNDEGNSKKFAASLSRIFSNTSRRKNHPAKEFRAAVSDSPTDHEDHFEITKIPLSSSDDSNVKENGCEIRNKKSDLIDDIKEEFVAIKSLDSTHDSDSYDADKESIAKRSLKVSAEGKNDALVLSVSVELANGIATGQSIKNIHKGTIVSYAPMVESAKYLSDDERDDDRFMDDETVSEKKLSFGKSFSTIRKLFSKASMQRSKHDREASENCSIDKIDHEGKQENSSRSVKSVTIKQGKNKDRFKDKLNSEVEQKFVDGKIGVKSENETEKKRKNYHELKTRSSKSELNNRKPAGGAIEYRNESVDEQKHRVSIQDLGNSSKIMGMGSKETNVVVNKVEVNQLAGLRRAEIVEQVVEEIVTSDVNQMDLNTKMNEMEKTVGQQSTFNDEDIDDAKPELDEKVRNEISEASIIPTNEDLKRSSKEQGVPKSQSVLSRGLKKLFKKRSSVVSDKNVDQLRQSADKNAIIETESTHNENVVQKSSEIQFAVFNTAASKTNCFSNYEEVSKKLENKNSEDESKQQTGSKSNNRLSMKLKSKKKDNEMGSASSALTNSEIRTKTSFPTQDDNPRGIENRRIQDDNPGEKQSRSKIGSKDFGLNRSSFASRKSTIVMMATAVPPRRESHHTDESESSSAPQTESSSSPTAFYYLLGPTLDEALIDVRVVFQNLIDKIIGKNR